VCFITPLVGSVDSPHVLVACSFASVGFFGNNESSTQTHRSLSLKLPYYKWHRIYHTGIHSKIVTTTSANASVPYNPATPATTLTPPTHNTPLAATPSTLPHTQVTYALCECTKTCSFMVY
jgi:hypothetical protein